MEGCWLLEDLFPLFVAFSSLPASVDVAGVALVEALDLLDLGEPDEFEVVPCDEPCHAGGVVTNGNLRRSWSSSTLKRGRIESTLSFKLHIKARANEGSSSANAEADKPRMSSFLISLDAY